MKYTRVVVLESHFADQLTEDINKALNDKKSYEECVEVDVQIARSGKYLATLKFEEC